MKKSELRTMVQDVLKEELAKPEATPVKESNRFGADPDLLATHILNDPDFEAACYAGDATKIMQIIDTVIERDGLQTAGAKKLRNEIFLMTKGNAHIAVGVGANIYQRVWNSRLSGNGLSMSRGA